MAKKKLFSELFTIDKEWQKCWEGMPEFSREDQAPFKSIYVHFDSVHDMKAFSELVGQKITIKTQSICYPKATIKRVADKVYVTKGYKKNEP